MRVKVFVKICGVTRPQDAELAASLGADAIGLVFWAKSPRAVSVAQARRIVAAVPPGVRKVGVFADEDAGEIVRVMDETGLDTAQLHGSETPEFCQTLGRPVFKAVHAARSEADRLAAYGPDVVLLVDAHDPVRLGGTGKTADWDAARVIAQTRRTILAGGLNAANIKLALRTVMPFGVDVSSGVEASPGVKDPGKLRTFFEALHD